MKFDQKEKRQSCFAIAYDMTKQAYLGRRRGSAKGHVNEIMTDPVLVTILLACASLIYLPRAIRLVRRPIIPEARKVPAQARAIAEPTPPPAGPANVDETALLRAWSAESIGRRESLEMLSDYIVRPQCIYDGCWRKTSIPILCGYREDVYMLFEKLHGDDELSGLRENLFRQLHRRRGEERMQRLRDVWPAIEREARRFAAIRERRRLNEDDEPREPQERLRLGR